MAPEVLCKQVHSYPVDFYALGVIAYELIMGKVDFWIILEALSWK
jgi:serum/glucocorticoid-regulated kinase 2